MTARTDYAAETDLVLAAAEADMVGWWRSSESMKPTARERGLRAFMIRLTRVYGAVAADAAAGYLFREWAEYGGDYLTIPYPDIAPPPPEDQLIESADWAMQTHAGGLLVAVGTEVRDRAIGVLVKTVMQQARETIAEGTSRAGTLYARVPETGACGFCKMLASRGGVYAAKSKDAVKFHDNCRCTVLQVRSDRDLPASSKKLMREWASWADAAEARGEAIDINNWSRHQYAKSKK